MRYTIATALGGARLIRGPSGTSIATLGEGSAAILAAFSQSLATTPGAMLYDEDAGQYIVGTVDQFVEETLEQSPSPARNGEMRPFTVKICATTFVSVDHVEATSPEHAIELANKNIDLAKIFDSNYRGPANEKLSTPLAIGYTQYVKELTTYLVNEKSTEDEIGDGTYFSVDLNGNLIQA